MMSYDDHDACNIIDIPPEALPSWENDQNYDALTASSQIWAFET